MNLDSRSERKCESFLNQLKLNCSESSQTPKLPPGSFECSISADMLHLENALPSITELRSLLNHGSLFKSFLKDPWIKLLSSNFKYKQSPRALEAIQGIVYATPTFLTSLSWDFGLNVTATAKTFRHFLWSLNPQI